MEQKDSPEIEPRTDAGDVSCRVGAQLLEQQRFDVSWANAPGRQLFSISPLSQERLAPELLRGTLDRILELEVLEGMQRVVVDEDADWTLRGQHVRKLIDHTRQRMVWRIGAGKHREPIERS
jgi:hypothetical protein